MQREYSREIAEAISDLLTEDDWNYSFNEEGGVFDFSVGSKTKLRKMNYFIFVEKEAWSVIVKLPIGGEAGDKEQMLRLAEFICRANYGLRTGKFELDMDDGEIIYRILVDDVDVETVNPDAIRRSIMLGGLMVERYAEGILGILFSDISPKEAIEKCEQKKSSL